ncbi:vacuolar-type H+-ATPase subunit H [Chromobacterium alkanivorans]|uniref:hypothetical protein n=1 Tax=Chromobacterium alkanivorans TaxID=1071719 RepID=UPI002167B76C|nr:hypothetical protein [Chromobacterium alkanivorans]MCS3803550.1 vacuolar-type H+-ATPase subunit H [Chromobacterium alkanivorans]MCS3817340.1 vacuolar-type H+-ATPase subunit H [Chromobacterium alkanivorans]MCS3872916.1 vacuolar-type H+-ATPase subunit H [Chromobacterium alkanivorans]
MPRDIPTTRPPTAAEGVLVRRGQLRRAERADRLEREARQQAQRLLREAERQAEALRRQASQEGYQQGMLAALEHAAAHLAANQAMAWRWRERLEQEARAMLTAAVDHPDTLLLLLDEWLRDLDQPDATLYLQLPKRARALQPQLMTLLTENWPGAIQIDYHADTRFMMRCADQAAEFSPEQYVEPASRQLLQCLEPLPQDCRRLSEQALRGLIARLEQDLAALAAADRSPE